MEFLGFDSGSDDGEEVKPVQCQWIDSGGESSEDEEEQETSSAPVTTVSASALPSAAELFSSAFEGPKYLNPGSVTAKELPSFSKPIVVEAKKGTDEKPEPKLESVPKVASEIFTTTGKLTGTTNSKAVPVQSSTVGKGKGKKGDAETAKDRVKRQRISGQSGIGSDFKEWRSETEMALRQQFDS